MAKYETGLKIDSGASERGSRKGENMTLDESIKILEVSHEICFGMDEEFIDAYDMAIRSLEAWEEVKQEIHNNNITDFIAVQSVLDIINKHLKEDKE